MTVTILIPVYGVEKYIAECAHSLFRQTYSDIEYVFCDDCTPDRSIDILQQIASEYPTRKDSVRIIRNDENKGIGYTRGRLIASIHTEAFCFVDSDDVLPADAIEALVTTMKRNSTDIVVGGYAEYRDGKTGTPFIPSHQPAERYLRRVLCQNIESNRLWGKLYDSKVLTMLGEWFFDGIDYTEDLCVIARLAALCSRSWTDAIVYHYRTDNMTSYTKTPSERNMLSYFRAQHTILSFYHRRGHLPLALEVGIINAYRECVKSGIDIRKADNIIRYVPEHMSARLLLRLFHHDGRLTFKVADMLYRIIRILASTGVSK